MTKTTNRIAMTTMKQGVLIGVLATLLIFVGLTNAEGQDNGFNQIQSPQYVGLHGSACQAANLSQAMSFGATWSQAGVTNPNPIGSGKSFFVVCPIPLIDDDTAQPAADVTVSIVSLAGGSNAVSCTAIRRNGLNGTVVSAVAGSASGNATMEIQNVVRDVDLNYFALNESTSAVCSLPPQTGISGIGFDSD